MPIYEFRCNSCQARVSVFQRRVGAATGAKCDRCGSADLARLVSAFAFRRGNASDGGGFDEDMLLDGVDQSDPRAMAEWARRQADAMGEELPPNFDNMLDEMGSGGPADDDGGDSDFDF